MSSMKNPSAVISASQITNEQTLQHPFFVRDDTSGPDTLQVYYKDSPGIPHPFVIWGKPCQFGDEAGVFALYLPREKPQMTIMASEVPVPTPEHKMFWSNKEEEIVVAMEMFLSHSRCLVEHFCLSLREDDPSHDGDKGEYMMNFENGFQDAVIVLKASTVLAHLNVAMTTHQALVTSHENVIAMDVLGLPKSAIKDIPDGMVETMIRFRKGTVFHQQLRAARKCK